MNHEQLIALGLQGKFGDFVPAVDEDIAAVEEGLRVKLPDEYKVFLKRYGASLFGADVGFRSNEPSPWAVNGVESFDLFYGVSDDPGFDLRQINERLRGDIPVGAIAIGHDPGSNLILLSDGEVLFFDKETGSTYRIAQSFGKFLSSFELR
jgi:hypothetical protein